MIVPGALRANIQLTDTDETATGRPNFKGKQMRNYLIDYYTVTLEDCRGKTEY